MGRLESLKDKKWSPRSQASYEREAELRTQFSRVQSEIRQCKSLVNISEQQIDFLKKSVASGEMWAANLVPAEADKIRDAKARIEVFEPEAESLRAQIEAIENPTAGEIEARAQRQTALAEAALERLEIDHALGDVAKTIRELFEKRAAISGRMASLADEIELSLPVSPAQSKALGALQQFLEVDIEAEGAAWLDSLFGENQTTERYKVLDDTIRVAETLVNAGVYRRGEEIDLTAEQVAEIQSTEKTRITYNVDERPSGGLASGRRVEIREYRLQKVGGA